MTERKKKQSTSTETEIQALANSIGIDPKELFESLGEVRQKQEGVRQYVEERKDSIKRGARRAKKRFSL